MGLLQAFLNHPVAKRKRFSTGWRILAWQFQKRILRSDLVVNYVNDTKLLVRPGWPVASACAYFGLPEFGPMAMILHVLRPGELLLDIGAHIGTYSVAAASVGARATAIEPGTEAFDYFQSHLRMNAMQDKVVAINAAASATGDEVFITAGHGQQDHITHESTANSQRVKSVQVDTLFKHEISPVAVKIDVEGYEFEVLNGAPNVLQNAQVMCIETMELGNKYGRSDEEVIDQVYSTGFQQVLYFPFERRIERSDSARGMRIFVKDPDWVAERVRSAAPFTIHGLSV